jgi:parallel beta-helix repeat protein
VSTASALTKALASAKPGEKIALKAGSYVGNFVAATSGTKAQPIVLCGSSSAILDGGDQSKNYVFHIDHANYWTLSGFSVTNGQKGVVADGTTGSIITGLTVHAIGDEGIHLRDNSVANTVTGNTVSGTGLLKAKYGEGIYIGSAKSNWCSYSNCQPDRSDRNLIENNTISNTTAENVDIKEGTTGGILKGNSFNGTGMVEDGGDSWVDVKGNSWTITGNHGVHSINDGFQTHQILDGWGTDNVFSDNVAAVDGPGYGFSLTPVLGNKVQCNNTVTGAAQGTANVSCGA